MGSNAQKLTILYDTATDWLAVDTDFCSNCHYPLFNTRDSSSYYQNSTSLTQIQYGGTYINGYRSVDTASLDETSMPKTAIA